MGEIPIIQVEEWELLWYNIRYQANQWIKCPISLSSPP